jgi:hypothetical protein
MRAKLFGKYLSIFVGDWEVLLTITAFGAHLTRSFSRFFIGTNLAT